MVSSAGSQMATPQQLRKPPITEALVDVRAASTRPLDRGRLGDALRATYPKVREMREVQAGFEIKEGMSPVATAVDKGLSGLHYLTLDGLSIAQFRVDGFTHNRLSPYTTGDQVLTEA